MPAHLDDEGFLQKEDGLPRRNSQPHFIVLTNRKVFVKKALPFQNAAVQQYRTGTDDAQGKTAVVDPSAVFAVDFPGIDSQTFSNPDLIGVNHLVVGIALQLLQLPVQFGRPPLVITVQKTDPGVTGQPDAGVSGSAHSTLFLVEVANAMILEFFDDGSSLILGSVIDHNEFPVLEGLFPDRLDGTCQKRATVEGRDDDTDQ
jgi:hypothetical protein